MRTTIGGIGEADGKTIALIRRSLAVLQHCPGEPRREMRIDLFAGPRTPGRFIEMVDRPVRIIAFGSGENRAAGFAFKAMHEHDHRRIFGQIHVQPGHMCAKQRTRFEHWRTGHGPDLRQINPGQRTVFQTIRHLRTFTEDGPWNGPV